MDTAKFIHGFRNLTKFVTNNAEYKENSYFNPEIRDKVFSFWHKIIIKRFCFAGGADICEGSLFILDQTSLFRISQIL